MSQASILIVEDERIVAAAVQEVLRFMGYGVAGIADSGRKAVQMATEVQPDLVLMDIRLRGVLDGIEAAQEIQAELGIPVVYLTAYADKAMRERAEASEACGYVTKPFRLADLRSAIEGALRLHSKQNEKHNEAGADSQ